jgi:TonB family protein
LHLQRVQTNWLNHNILPGKQLPFCCLATELRQELGGSKSVPGFTLSSHQVLVALDTGQGITYAVASGWDRVRLLWMFRNFRSLPQNVLSPRQQQLIGSLYREISRHHPQEFHGATLIGTVQHFKPSSLATRATSVKATKPVPNIPVLDHKPFYAQFTFNRMTLKVGTAVLVAAIAVLAWHRLGAQPVATNDVIATNLKPVIVQPPPNPAAALTSAVALARTQTATAPSVRSLATAEITAKRADTSVVSSKRQPNDASAATRAATALAATTHSAFADLSSVYEAAANQPRLQISGRPRKLVYPVCPETRARGKVSLQAVVGYDGEVNRVRVLTGDRALAAAAVEAVRQWRYEPFSGAAPRLERETNITISFISNEVVAVSFPSSAPLSR